MADNKKEEEGHAVKVKQGDTMGSWKLIVIIVTPLLFLPLPLAVERVEAKCAYVILIMTTYWMTEALPLSVTALLPVPLYPLLGVESAGDTAANYFKDTNFLIFGSLLMAVAVEVSGLQYRIALRILLWFGARPQWLIFGFMNTAGFLSMWISNTATCAMMMPIVVVVLEEILRQKRRLEMAQRRQNVENPPSSAIDDQSIETLDSVFQENLSPEELGMCRAAAIGVSFASSVGGIGALTGASPNLILTGQLNQLYPKENAITFANWFAFGMPMQILFMVLGWLWLLLLFMGWRSTFRCFAKRTESDLSIAKLLRKEYEKLGPMRFDEAAMLFWFSFVILLWIFREPGFIPGWGSWFKDGYVSDSTPVILVSCILFAFPSTLTPFMWWQKRKVAGLTQSAKVTNTRCRPNCSLPSYRPLMSWRYMQEKFPWSVIILMGGGFALADGVKKSNLSIWLGCSLQSSLSSIKPAIVVLIFLTLMTAVSEFASNSATASVFVPILLTVAESLRINPLYFGLAAAVGSSFGFMLPVATPPNMIVFEKCKQLGILGTKDMIKAGLGLDIICILVAFVIMHTAGTWVYQLNVYPNWAHHVSNITQCT